MFAGTWVTRTVSLACREVVFGADVPGDEVSPWHSASGDMHAASELVVAVIRAVDDGTVV